MTSNLSEAVARFRALDEAVKVGDYVTDADGRHGYVNSVQGNMVSFWWVQYKQSKLIYMPKDKVNVNPGGPPR